MRGRSLILQSSSPDPRTHAHDDEDRSLDCLSLCTYEAERASGSPRPPRKEGGPVRVVAYTLRVSLEESDDSRATICESSSVSNSVSGVWSLNLFIIIMFMVFIII
jgi:hypothetical protein